MVTTPDDSARIDDWREDCAPRRVLDLFSTKWTSMVLHTLWARHAGQARSGALHRSLHACGMSRSAAALLTCGVLRVTRQDLRRVSVLQTSPRRAEARTVGAPS